MRIALLSHVEFGVPAHNCEHIKNVVSLLIKGLKEKNVDITVFDAESNTDGIDAKVLESLHISGLFEHAEDFDIIHSHSGFLPLSYSGLVTTPLLTTIYESLSMESLLIYKKYNGRAFYVRDANAASSAELDYVATISHNIDDDGFNLELMVDNYLGAYKTVLEKKQREDRRPWGHFSVLSDTPYQKSKLVHVFPGTRLSLQRHKRRNEHWHIVKGEALVTINGRQLTLKAGDSVEIPLQALHRIANSGKEVMTFFEVQTGDYLGEDDIERLEDDYARVK